MSTAEDTNGKTIVTASVRDIITIIASFVALLVGLSALIAAGSTYAVANHRLGVAENRVVQISQQVDQAEANFNLRSAEVAVIQSQLLDIKTQNGRILEKLNQL